MSYKDIDDIKKAAIYIANMRPVLNKKALFCDETENYRTPQEAEPGETVTIRFRTGKNNIDHLYYISEDKRLLMEKYQTEGVFDYYKIDITLDENPVYYYFELHCGKVHCYYNKKGVSKNLQEYYSFSIVPGFRTPDWAKGAVMYQIFVDRFCNGNPDNDVLDREYIYINEGTKRITDWSKFPDEMDVRSFYGGDLQGVMDKLDYIQSLGVEVIYFNPIFVSPSNHKYDIQDYDYIDPHFGVIVSDGGNTLPDWDNDNKNAERYIRRVTNKENLEASNAFFEKLVVEIHRRGMKVILDGVFNHCGSFNKWLDKERIYENQTDYEAGAYVSGDSPFRSFFKFNNEHDWPYNDFYDGWWGHNTLPKLNYENSPALYQYIMDVARKWLSPPYNVDGWRLDVAADLGYSNEYNHKFWKEFRKTVKECNPDALILAEHYGDPSSWLKGDEWDTVMNYDAFMEPITWFLTGMEKHSDEYRDDLLGNAEAFVGAMEHHMASFMNQSLQVAMNELSNHDHSRFLTRTNRKVGRIHTLGPEMAAEGVQRGVFMEAVVLQMTWPGAPTIYYGDEAGVCGFTDPDSRRTYPWGQEDQQLIAFHKEIIRIHKEHPALTGGSLFFLQTDYNVISYARFTADEKNVVILNNNPHDVHLDIPVWEAEIPKNAKLERLIMTCGDSYTTLSEIYQVDHMTLKIEMPPVSSVVLRML